MDGPEGYVYCEFTVGWWVSAKSDLRDSRLHVEVRLNDQPVEDGCPVDPGRDPLDRSFTLKFRLSDR